MIAEIGRFDRKIDINPDSDCWAWKGHINENGYGQFRFNGKPGKAHRFSYTFFKGLIPEGLQIDHLCRNRACCNPDHLEAVTHRENIRRGKAGEYNTVKTHCPQGHEYAGDNLYYTPRTGRLCKICNRLYSRNYARKQREKRKVVQ
jgi:hypothetical protein